MYCVKGLEPRTDIQLGAHGFAIDLMPGWPQWVARSGLTQAKVDHKLKTYAPLWLKACGQRVFHEGREIRIQWGEWGPEHICVPGNACGLDIDRGGSFGCLFRDGRSLHPHNVDSWVQKQLLLLAFTSFAEDVIVLGRQQETRKNEPAKDFRQMLENVVDAFQSLVSESDGVAGLHKNGDVASWLTLCSGGRFEEWCGVFDDAAAMLATAPKEMDDAANELPVDHPPVPGTNQDGDPAAGVVKTETRSGADGG